MHIHCLGLNHNTAPVQLRERMAFNEAQVNAALSRLGCGQLKIGELTELAILSTCNRVEIYAAGPVLDFSALEKFLAEIHGVEAGLFRPRLYHLADQEAIRHLLAVAAGLDSMVVGEPQILGQVTQAFSVARMQNSVGKVLSQLFSTAIQAGKRARTETTIAQNPASVASVAVKLVLQTVADLAGAQVVLLGAGEMAEGTLQALRKRGVTQIQVVNRTFERAQELAYRFEGEAATFEQLPQALEKADILISSTSAPHTLIHPTAVKTAMQKRPTRPLVMIDIAVPRDVDHEVAEIQNVTLFDMDDLHNYLDQAVQLRRQEIPQVEIILEEELQNYRDYLDTLDVLPIIAGMRQKVEEIRVRELQRTLPKLPGLTEAERKHLEAMTTALVKKILHDPILRLRAEAGGPEASEYSQITRALFDLNGKNNSCSGLPRQESAQPAQRSETSWN